MHAERSKRSESVKNLRMGSRLVWLTPKMDQMLTMRKESDPIEIHQKGQRMSRFVLAF